MTSRGRSYVGVVIAAGVYDVPRTIGRVSDQPIDLRSDTVTKPTQGMRAAMAAAEVGDDVYAEDPTVLALEERVAALFGKEAALFTPTGSMANVLAVRSVVDVGEEVLCESSAHIARAELGAHGAISGVTMRTWTGDRGGVDLDAVESLFAPDLGPFFVPTKAISVENTHNFAGGSVLPLQDLAALRAFASSVGAAVHLDGARIWNAHAATGVALEEYGGLVDVLAVCLSKGLGAPVGSLMVGSTAAVAEARVWRKRLGGGMRQVGILAAGGLYALDHHLERLAEDHANARLLAEACDVDPAGVETNIVVVEVPDAAAVVGLAREAGVLVGAVGPRTVRMVTHLDVSAAQADAAASVMAAVLADAG
jgi:threonine aldolase